ncbi:MAG: RraA family protein [Gammaproteobacteria bacterium]|nr:RraA family protein [Gammaproteobacteria bacterium]
MIGNPIALAIRREPARPPASLVEQFAGVQTSFIADAMQGWNCLHYSIKAQTPEHRFCGIALTANNGPRDILAAMAMLDHVTEGDVLVIATGRDESGAVVGDHWATIARQMGAAAVVTDGLVRDIAGIDPLGMPVFARGVSPNAGYRNGPGSINSTVSVGGVSISPGDILVGDRDGVVVVPQSQAEHVAQRLAAIKQAEQAMEQKVSAGEVRRLWDPAAFEERGVEYVD